MDKPFRLIQFDPLQIVCCGALFTSRNHLMSDSWYIVVCELNRRERFSLAYSRDLYYSVCETLLLHSAMSYFQVHCSKTAT